MTAHDRAHDPVSDDLTARDVIAQLLDVFPYSTPVGLIADRMPDTILDTLRDAGYTIVTTNGWEWGVRRPDGSVDGPAGEVLIRRVHSHDGGTVVRRRPAGPWEVVPDAR